MPDIQQRLNCLLQLAIQQARAADIPVSSRISPSVQLNCRAKTRLGCCRTTRESAPCWAACWPYRQRFAFTSWGLEA